MLSETVSHNKICKPTNHKCRKLDGEVEVANLKLCRFGKVRILKKKSAKRTSSPNHPNESPAAGDFRSLIFVCCTQISHRGSLETNLHAVSVFIVSEHSRKIALQYRARDLLMRTRRLYYSLIVLLSLLRTVDQNFQLRREHPKCWCFFADLKEYSICEALATALHELLCVKTDPNNPDAGLKCTVVSS